MSVKAFEMPDLPAWPRCLERLFREIENVERAESGMEPLPYTADDCHGDEGRLRETIPAYYRREAWQTNQERVFLDKWERDLRERVGGA